MSYVILMSVITYRFDCDEDGCTATHEIRALNIDRARGRLHEA